MINNIKYRMKYCDRSRDGPVVQKSDVLPARCHACIYEYNFLNKKRNVTYVVCTRNTYIYITQRVS